MVRGNTRNEYKSFENESNAKTNYNIPSTYPYKRRTSTFSLPVFSLSRNSNV